MHDQRADEGALEDEPCARGGELGADLLPGASCPMPEDVAYWASAPQRSAITSYSMRSGDAVRPVGECGHVEERFADGTVHVSHEHDPHLPLRETLRIVEDVTVDAVGIGAVRRVAGTPHQRRGNAVLEVDVRRASLRSPRRMASISGSRCMLSMNAFNSIPAALPTKRLRRASPSNAGIPWNFSARDARTPTIAGWERQSGCGPDQSRTAVPAGTGGGDDPVIDPCVIGPRDPVVQVRLQLVVGEPVREAVPASRRCTPRSPCRFPAAKIAQPSGTRYSPSRRSRIN